MEEFVEIMCEECLTVFRRSLKSKAVNSFCSTRCLNISGTMSKSRKVIDTTVERFWPRVDKEPGQGPNGDCWEWQGSTNKYGYGQYWINALKRCVGAHRVSYSICNEVPLEEFALPMVCHSCDNRKCCNPAHLFLGTAKDNAQDMIAKGRCNPPKGENAYTAKLTSDQVLEILLSHETQVALGLKYGVSASAISEIRSRSRYKDVAPEIAPIQAPFYTFKDLGRASLLPLPRKGLSKKQKFEYYTKPPEDSNACWEWLGRVTFLGYGIMPFTGSKAGIPAHRVSYELFKLKKGESIEGANICHSCDNPRCVNPAHLFKADFLTNMKDKKSKNRQSRNPVLGRDNAIKVKILLQEGKTLKEIAMLCNMHPVSVQAIKSGRSYKNLEIPEGWEGNLCNHSSYDRVD